MRVTTNAMFSHISDSTSNHFIAISEQMKHSQYKVLQSGDDPISQGRIINLNRSISELEGYKTSASVLQTELIEIESRTKSYGELFNNVNTLVNKITSGTHNSEDLKQMSKELDGMSDDLAQILNMKNTNGDYVFGGTLTDAPPFVKEKTNVNIDGVDREVEIWVYKGNSDQKLTKIGSSVSLPSTVDGSKLVGDGNTTIFENIAKAQHYISQGQDIPEKVLDEIETGFETLLDAKLSFESEIGQDYASAERNTNTYQGMIDEYTGLLSTTQDANYLEVVTEIKKQQQIMQVLSQSSKVLMEMATLSFK
jgi:flagellin-like hook-associated protein FlgL